MWLLNIQYQRHHQVRDEMHYATHAVDKLLSNLNDVQLGLLV